MTIDSRTAGSNVPQAPQGTTLPRDFYNRDPRDVAVDLLGRTLVHENDGITTAGIIVETEAYRPDDPACHAYRGPTMRNRTMFSRPGLAYVYVSYGIHHLINVVCEEEGVGSAVLIRALRPTHGLDAMEKRRGRPRDLCNGPGKLSQALGVDLSRDACDLSTGKLKVLDGGPPEGEVISTTRIGITRGVEYPWRYLVLEEKDVSAKPVRVCERDFKRKL